MKIMVLILLLMTMMVMMTSMTAMTKNCINLGAALDSPAEIRFFSLMFASQLGQLPLTIRTSLFQHLNKGALASTEDCQLHFLALVNFLKLN